MLLLSCRFGFVVFESHEHASKALQNLQGKDLNGRNMVLSYALKKKSKPGKPKQGLLQNIFVVVHQK